MRISNPDGTAPSLGVRESHSNPTCPHLRQALDRATSGAHTILMTLPGGGPIVGYAIVKALGQEQETAARAKDAAVGRAVLDEAELRELEYEVMGLPVPVNSTSNRSIRSLLRRIIGR